MLTEVRINEKDTSLYEVIIDDGSKESEPITRKRIIKTHSYMRNILDKSNNSCGILPKNCKYIQNDGNQTLMVVEAPPKIRPLRFDYDFIRELSDIKSSGIIDYNSIKKLIKPKDINLIRLTFPYTVFVMAINGSKGRWESHSFRVFFRIHPIKRENDYLFSTNIVNLSERNELCFGESINLNESDMELNDVAEKLINEFWVRPFTYEYSTRYALYKNISILNNFLVWAYYSEKDPMFIYNANWLLHGRNLRQELDAMVLEIDGSSSNTRFHLFFADTTIPGIEKDKVYFETLKLETRVLSVGDQLKFDDKDLYVYGFVGDRNGPTHIVFTDIEGNEMEPVRITNQLKNDWDSQIENQLLNYIEKIQLGDVMVQVGDIIKIVSTNVYEVVDRIRISRDNIVEFECNGRYYLAREGNIKTIKSVDANGIELVPNKEYIICHNQFQHGYVGKMTKVQNSSDNNLLNVYFYDIATERENTVSMNLLEEGDVVIFPLDDNIRKIRTFRYMNKIYTNNGEYLIVKDRGVYDIRGNESDLFRHTLSPVATINDVFNEDKTELTILGIDKDINFKLGDKIVIGDWDNPHELMFKVREIVEFVIRGNVIFIKAKDSEDNVMQTEYINCNTGFIRIGYIRKVVNEYNDIPAGTIVIANQAGICNFPKRDRNKIVAFIIDSAEPLVLFQSGLTLWFSDLDSKFDLLLPGTDSYKRIRKIQTLNLEEIKWQPGDLCVRNGINYLLNNDNPYMGNVYMEINPDFVKTGSLRSRAKVVTSLDASFKRFGIIDPRYLKKDSEVRYEMVPDFYNGCYEVPFDGYYPYTVRRTS